MCFMRNLETLHHKLCHSSSLERPGCIFTIDRNAFRSTSLDVDGISSSTSKFNYGLVLEDIR
eukprot:snap_masked-scaffold_40-processed-gene-1.41-mRNA-1 protein AED:1.00 eAED:1.00 QI:0/-1/0/0/-1/1/1/0/61